MLVMMTDVHVSKIRVDQSLRKLLGFCCDIGMPKSVVGRKGLDRILTTLRRHNRYILPSQNRFSFADTVLHSLGRITVPLLTHPGVPKVLVEMDIVDADNQPCWEWTSWTGNP